MEFAIDNSFFHQDLNGLKVLAIVPHEDDEINTCGALLKNLTECGANVILVYTTNGDWKYPALTRMKEAKESASLIGIKENNIFFLGYGDAINNDEHNHIFYTMDAPTKSASGHSETYGTKLYQDYSFKISGKHHSYIRKNFLNDIIHVVETERADLLICTDFDEHPDHRMLSLLFDQAVGIVCKNYPDYRPEIWKRFAYSLAYTAVPDYCAINNAETKRPDIETTGKYAFDFIDKSIYSWKERIRIPVPFSECENIRTNFITKALLKHKSQYIITHADRIINSDEVYWRRRTDNLAFTASVTTSSGEGSFLNDFSVYGTKDVDSLVPIFSDYFWRPDDNDDEKRVEISWNSPQHIEQIVLYGTIDSESKVKELSIQLDDGYTCTVKDIPGDGSPQYIDVGSHDSITHCTIKIISYEGLNYGLSECEIYSKATVCSHIKPFIKIISNDNFLYEHLIGEGTETISLDIYQFGVDAEECQFEVLKGNSRIEEKKLYVDPSDKEIVIRCTSPSMNVYDQIKVKRLTDQEYSSRRREVLRDREFLNSKRRLMKFHNMFYILSKQGPYAVVKRTVKNILLPRLRKKKHGKQ